MDPLAERLRKERVARGLSTAELANQTKVREPYIVALERGMYNVLPAVYVRSFIKTLASSLGIPQHEIQRLISAVLDGQHSDDSRRYQADTPQQTHYSTAENVERTADTVTNLITQSKTSVQSAYAAMFRKKSNTKQRIVITSLVAIAAIAILVIIFRNSSGSPTTSGSPDVVEIGPQDSLRLLAVADDTCEFTITIDNQRNEKVLLLPGNEHTWGAMDRFVINNIFNAGAIRFSRNGEPFRQFAKTNEVLRELTITRKDVIASNAPIRQAPTPKPESSTTRAASPERRR
jgi:transcriptional regulator with XRE-family HTH domain